MSDLGDRLKLALAEIGGTLAEAAKRSGIPYRSLQNYTAASSELAQQPGAEALFKIRKAFGISIDWLLTGEGDKFAKSANFSPREITMRDYQELRARFSNFDEVFSINNPWDFADVKIQLPEIEARKWRSIIRHLSETHNLDLTAFLQERNLEAMPNEELREVATKITESIPSRR